MKDYVLVERIALGGMAEVFMAHGIDKKPVVVKKILPHLEGNQECIDMFQRELNILNSLKHENIVQVIESKEKYVVMEYLDGYSWSELFAYKIPENMVIYMFLESLKALHYVHQNKVIHRDISPQNWMLTNRGRVKLLDFGISKLEQESGERTTGFLKGKYSYMAPEQVFGEKASVQSDIFSMGVILFELCTCSRLFKQKTDILTLQAITKCRVRVPDFIHPELASIIYKALALNKADRFKNCQEFRWALENYAKRFNRLATSHQVLELIRRFPRIRNRNLLETTKIIIRKNNQTGVAIFVLFFAVLGFCF